ncbi:MAG: hypothetical protein ACRC0L_04765 [Angustibacter sp.]
MSRCAHRAGMAALAALTLIVPACGGGAQIASLVQAKKPAEEMFTSLEAALTKAGVVELAPLEGEPPVPTPKSAQAWIDFAKTPRGLDVLVDTGDGSVALRQVGAGVTYIKIDNSDKWIEVKTGDKKAKNLLPLVELSKAFTNPLAELDLVTKIATEDGFKDVGTVTLDGTALTHWQAVQPAGTQKAEWLKDVEPDPSPDTKAPDTLDVWLDDKGFPRRIAQSHQGQLLGFGLKPSTAGTHFAKPSSSSIIQPQG